MLKAVRSDDVQLVINQLTAGLTEIYKIKNYISRLRELGIPEVALRKYASYATAWTVRNLNAEYPPSLPEFLLQESVQDAILSGLHL